MNLHSTDKRIYNTKSRLKDSIVSFSFMFDYGFTSVGKLLRSVRFGFASQ
ncbi:hypothetical protein [Helicobacter rodentium]|nr:hypothetical protein [Helicobacter rodentium]